MHFCKTTKTDLRHAYNRKQISVIIQHTPTRGVTTEGYIGIYTPPPHKKSSVYLTNFDVVTGCFFLFDPGQIRYRASVRLSSFFFYLLTHRNLYPPPKWNSWLCPWPPPNLVRIYFDSHWLTPTFFPHSFSLWSSKLAIEYLVKHFAENCHFAAPPLRVSPNQYVLWCVSENYPHDMLDIFSEILRHKTKSAHCKLSVFLSLKNGRRISEN